MIRWILTGKISIGNSSLDILTPIRTASPIIPSAVNLEVSIAVQIKSYSLSLACVSLHILSPLLVPEATLPASACDQTQSIAATHHHRSRVSYLVCKPESVLYVQAYKMIGFALRMILQTSSISIRRCLSEEACACNATTICRICYICSVR